jgi:hypothetical protein
MSPDEEDEGPSPHGLSSSNDDDDDDVSFITGIKRPPSFLNHLKFGKIVVSEEIRYNKIHTYICIHCIIVCSM